MRRYLLVGWVLLISLGLYLYFFHAGFLENQLQLAFRQSIYLGYGLFLLLGFLRGFTLIPSTYLIVLGLLFFPPLPLYILTMTGIIVSSVFVYYFSEALRFDQMLNRKHQKQVVEIRTALEKNELPIIIGWSAFPFLPTDVICYVCGALRVNIAKFILGILIGEGAIVAVYIFFGSSALQYIRAL